MQEDMRPHFRAFVNRTDFADLTIQCADGSCVAHRVLILARTPHLYRKWCPGPPQTRGDIDTQTRIDTLNNTASNRSAEW